MNLQEIIIRPNGEPESLHGPDDEDDGISLTSFSAEDDLVDPWLAELCSQLIGLDSEVSVRMVLWLYLGDRLPGVRWGEVEV